MNFLDDEERARLKSQHRQKREERFFQKLKSRVRDKFNPIGVLATKF